ncbi:MAG: TonB-dependent receptor [Ignavibacterium sp.]|jgi:outer membrane receptor for ferrienterochelin and colicin|nr:TonB-dependent receptor [Ignavibacterium sp.]
MKKINLKLVILMIVIAFSTFANESLKGTITGQVIDRDTKQEIPGAVIEVMNAAVLTATDVHGDFTIEGLDPKTYNLKISAPYYVTTYKTDVLVTGKQSTKIVIELKLASYETEEVIVSGERFFDKPNDLVTSTNSLSSEEIRRAPGAVEDLNRMVQSLPGVTTATDSRNDLIVRGGSPVENFILVEGIEVPNINHFGTQGASGGPIGMINVDFLNDVTFNAGGFPAKYGDRLSSIMDVEYRNGDRNNFNGKVDIGIAGGGIILEGPIQEGKSSYLFSARKSYLDLILSSTGLTAVPNYTNFNLKTTYELSEKHKLSIIGLGGIDKINFKGYESEDDPFINSTNFSGWQAAVGIVHKWLVGNQTYLQTSISTNQYQREVAEDSVGKPVFNNESLDKEYILRSDLSQRFSPTDLLEVGFTAKYLSNDNTIFRAKTIDIYGSVLPELNYSAIAEAYKFGPYVQYSKKLFGRLDLTAGLRYDYFDYLNNESTISPRASAGFYILENLKLNATYGIYHQAPPLLWLVSYDQNKDLKQIKTEQFVTGMEYYPASDLKITLEYFEKQYSDYPNSVLNPQVTYANTGAEYQTLGLEPLLPASDGYARGVEFFIQKKLTNGLYGMFNYSFSKIRFTSLDGIERPSSFDYQNVLTAILGYKITNNLEVSAKYRFMGGRPYTPLDEAASAQFNQTIYDYTKYNAVRYDDYQRLDVRVDYRFELFGWLLTTYLDFQNILNIENVDQIIWNQKTQQVDYIYQWKFLPAGGIKIEF